MYGERENRAGLEKDKYRARREQMNYADFHIISELVSCQVGSLDISTFHLMHGLCVYCISVWDAF